MRVKKYFVSKYQKEAGKKTGVQTVIFWRNQEKSWLWALYLGFF
jgi:hypothetical protein